MAFQGKFPNRAGADAERLLVTGFGPFPGMPRNLSAAIARRVAASPRWRWIGAEAALLVLETSYAALRKELEPALRDGGFSAALMLGVAGRTKHIRVELRAANRASLFLPDAAKRLPDLRVGVGPARRIARVNAPAIRTVLRRAGLPCALSQDAGRYLCNAAYFTALGEHIPVVFLHVPRPPPGTRPRRGTPAKRQGWEERIAAAFVEVGVQLIRTARRTS